VDGFVWLLAVAIAAAAVWFVAKPDAVFVVRVRAGHAETTTGKTTGSFLTAVVGVCQEFGLQAAEIRGVARGRRIALRFSNNFPSAARQRLRNWWVEYGWSVPARSRPRR
jgi:hypothetical protein